jgi:hypothetical protein
VKWLKSNGPATSLKVTVFVAGFHFTYSESDAAGAVPAAAGVTTGGESVGGAATLAAADSVAVVDPLSAAGAAPPDGSGDRLEHPVAVASEAAIKSTREKPLSIRNIMPASRVRATIVDGETKMAWSPKYGRCSAPVARLY